MIYDIIIRFNKRILSIALSIVIVFTLFPFVAPTLIVSAAEQSAVEILKPTVDNKGKVTGARILEYAGKEWYVIACCSASGSTGVQIAENAVTRNDGETTIVLLAKETLNVSVSANLPGYVPFSSEANGYTGKYKDSNLQAIIDSYAAEIENNNANEGKEKDLIAKRYLEGSPLDSSTYDNWYKSASDKILGDAVTEATLWPLSLHEVDQINGNFLNSFSDKEWWLRSPGGYIGAATKNEGGSGEYSRNSSVSVEKGKSTWTKVRPAMCLNLTTDIGVALKENESNVYVLKFPSHNHEFTYSGGAEDDTDTITATCINEESDCSLDDRKVNLTIVKPARTVFGGSESEEATLTGLEDFNSATGKSVSASDIKYVGRDGTSYDSTTAPTDAGNYTASITIDGVKTDAGENQSITASVDYEIAKAAGSISYGSGIVNRTYGDDAFTNTLSHTGDGTVTYTSSDTSVAKVDSSTGEVSIVGVGDTDITATVEDGKNYTYSVKEASYKLTVNRADMEVDVTGYDGACDGQSHSISVNVTKPTEGYTITYGLEEGAYSLTENPAVSTVSDSKRVYFKITAPYYNDYTSSAEIKLTKGNQVISADDVNVSYGGTGSVSAESNGDGTISYDVKSGSEDYIAVDSTTGELTIKKVPVDGKACVTVTAGETDDYNEATKDVNIKISKATIKITANDYNISVGDQIPELTSTECYYVTGLVGDDALTTTPTLKYQQSGSNKELSGTATALNLGTYDIVPTGADAGGNYAIDYVKGKLTINKATPTVTAPVPKELTFNGVDQELVTGGTTSGGEMQYAIGSESGPTGSWSTDIPEETDAGTYYVWYKVAEDESYGATEAAPVPVTISPKSIANATVTLSETEFTYDDQEHTVSVTEVKLEDGTVLSRDDYVTNTEGTTGTNKGEYTVTVVANNNYTGSATANWNIGMATPIINTEPTANPITYGQTLDESSLSGGEANVPGTFTWKVPETKPAVSDSDSTTYEVIFTPDDTENYTTTSFRISVTVNKAASPSENPAPTPKEELTDNGHPQKLVNTVPVTGGTIEYVIGVDDKTPPTSGWGPDIPTASKPGTYYIWYKVVGDENHFDSDPKCIVVTIEKPVYSNYEGDGGKWTKGSTDGLKFTFKRSAEDVTTIEHFAGILVDGKEVAESNYDAVSGSVVITLKAPYLETLSAGEHILTAKFNDGDSADAGFTIIEVPAADDNNDSKAGDDSKSGGTADSNESKKTDVKNPDKSDKSSEKTTSTVGASKNHKTGDEVPIGLIMIIGLASLAGAVWSLVLKKNLKPTKK